MRPAQVLSTLAILLCAFNYCYAFRLHPIDGGWVRRWEQDHDIVGQVFKTTDQQSTQCGYQACDTGKEGFINVHLVPHTHNDVGWLKTVDEYYYGARNDIQVAGVQYILDSVVHELENNKARRFIYVEIAFFIRWWRNQHDYIRHRVKALVNAGRLEFILGGWCMNDEATTHYSAIIDQHTLGFQFLKRNFGECGRPRVAWQIDPFGHSREQASLFAQMGFDGLFFARLDYQDYAARKQAKQMELIWHGSQSLGDQASLFTGVLYGPLYGPPHGFRFESTRNDPPIMDDQRLEDYNVDSRVKDFLANVTSQAKAFSTNHIMMTMGGDFEYQNALINYKNIDKLIGYVNAAAVSAKVNVLYSTPSCYVYALNKANKTYTHKQDDFFPYASQPHAFWTGFFTSRPSLKGHERSSNNFFQVCRQLDALTRLGPEHGSDKKLLVLRDAMAIVQHHDAVSGTEQQHVANDYAKRLASGVAECEDVVNIAFSKLLPKSSKVTAPVFKFCPLLNISYCAVTEASQQFAVTVYNPIGRNVSVWVRVPVTGKSYVISDHQMNPISSQVVPLSEATLNLPDRKGSKATGSLVFAASVSALGFSTFFVKEAAVGEGTSKQSSLRQVQQADVVIRNQHLVVAFDGTSGLMKTVTNTDKRISVGIEQSLLYYRSYPKVEKDYPTSGAYIFRSVNSSIYPFSDKVQISVVQGPQVQEVRQTFGSWGSQIVRLYNGTKHIEIEWTVGPIPTSDGIGREVISRFSTSLRTNATFYTDANGREILQRVRNYRPTWKLNQTEAVAGNYYPVNSRIYIQDKAKKVQLTVLTDRSLGGGSIYDGEIELMLHRRLVNDDGLGVREILNETGSDGRGLIVRGKQYVYLDDIASSVQLHRDTAQRLYMAPSLAFTPIETSIHDYASKFHTQWSALKRFLPDNVHLLTLEQFEAATLLLRLEHFYAKYEDPVLSQPAKVQLKDLFVPLRIKSVEELTLGANQKLSDAKRLQWNVRDFGTTASDMNSFVVPYNQTTLEIVLKPMQIRTFQVTLE